MANNLTLTQAARFLRMSRQNVRHLASLRGWTLTRTRARRGRPADMVDTSDIRKELVARIVAAEQELAAMRAAIAELAHD